MNDCSYEGSKCPLRTEEFPFYIFVKYHFATIFFKTCFLMLHFLIPSGDNRQTHRGLFLPSAKLLCHAQNLREELTDNLGKDSPKTNCFEKL